MPIRNSSRLFSGTNALRSAKVSSAKSTTRQKDTENTLRRPRFQQLIALFFGAAGQFCIVPWPSDLLNEKRCPTLAAPSVLREKCLAASSPSSTVPDTAD